MVSLKEKAEGNHHGKRNKAVCSKNILIPLSKTFGHLKLILFRFNCAHVKPHSELREDETYDPLNSDCLLDNKGKIQNASSLWFISKNLIIDQVNLTVLGLAHLSRFI